MSDLQAIMDKPEANQLYTSILNYMNSGSFNPVDSITFEELSSLFGMQAKAGETKVLDNISY
jgi:hypothetical protein